MLIQPWSVPKIWDNSTAFLIGGGPSVNDMNLALIHDKHVIGVNDAFKLGDWVDFVWFGDQRWYEWNKAHINRYPGIVTGCPHTSKRMSRVLQVNRNEGSGISTNPTYVMWNKSSGACAINFAYLLGARRIILIGYDMKTREGKHNWHSNHKHVPRQDIYERRFLLPFTRIAQDAERLGLEIINATPDSALTVFPYQSLEQIVEGGDHGKIST